MQKVISKFNRYSCNELGEIFNNKTGGRLNPSLTPRGYLIVGLYDSDGVIKSVNVHRIIAETFIPKNNNSFIVNHKNHIKTDNRVSNLEWVTQKENVNQAIKKGLWKNNMKPVVEVDANGKIINKFRSVNECAEFYNTDSSLISRVCNGKAKAYKGKIFKFAKKSS